MRKIRQIEVSEIKPNIKMPDLYNLQKKFPDLQMSFEVELYGVGKQSNINDGPAKEVLRRLNNLKTHHKSKLKTAIRLKEGYANVFRKNYNFQEDEIWDFIRQTNPDKVVFDFSSLTNLQKQEFSVENFYDFLKTKANPEAHDLYSDIRLNCPKLYEHFFAYLNADYYIKVQPSQRRFYSETESTRTYIFDRLLEKNVDFLQLDRVKGLYVMQSFDKISTYKDRYIIRQTSESISGYLESWIVPKSWTGGICSDNVKKALDVIVKKLDYKIEEIDISTDGGGDNIHEIEAFMQNANEWQKEFNQKINAREYNS
jgi:hypothetical protein